MKKFTIPKPKKLAEKFLYSSEQKCYCAVGYLGKHILNIESNKEINSDFYSVSEIIKGLIEKLNCTSVDITSLIESNDRVSDNKSRLDLFKEFCDNHGIELV